MAALAAYILKLAQSPAEKALFDADPEFARTSMTEAGLSREQQDALLSKDHERIRRAIYADLGDTETEPEPYLLRIITDWICARPPDT